MQNKKRTGKLVFQLQSRSALWCRTEGWYSLYPSGSASETSRLVTISLVLLYLLCYKPHGPGRWVTHSWERGGETRYMWAKLTSHQEETDIRWDAAIAISQRPVNNRWIRQSIEHSLLLSHRRLIKTLSYQADGQTDGGIRNILFTDAFIRYPLSETGVGSALFRIWWNYYHRDWIISPAGQFSGLRAERG